jgi:general secretion pathway protein K
MKKICQTTKYKSGLILVVVLWIIVILAVIVASMAQTSRIETRIGLSAAEQTRCRWACSAGIETAKAALQDDETQSDGPEDIWYGSNADFNEVLLDRCRFTVMVTDEASKLNVNTATRKQLMALPNMTDEIADAIIDWRDEDDKPRPLGVELQYYLKLPNGYPIRNGNFRTIRELLLVRGITNEIFYGEDTNLNGRLDYNEKDRDESLPNDNSDNVLDVSLIAYLTCYSYDINKDAEDNDRVNINSADENNLVNSLNISRGHAKWIVENRSENYTSVADLINENSPKKASNSGGNSDQAQRLDLETFKSIVDKITITDEATIPGRVNVNTASKEVLVALLEGNESVAQAIINHRENLSESMLTIGSLLDVPLFGIKGFKKVANHLTTRSSIFTIKSSAVAEATGMQGVAEIVLDRRGQTPRMLYRYKGTGI